MDESDPVAEFRSHRGRLFGLAYRMLGSAASAEDMVQEAFLRWSGADHASIASPGAWLAKTVTNLCLNHLDSARVRREQYVGPWLPEPVLTEDGALGPLELAQQRESVSMALLALLEQLAPAERAVFVLREAFGYDHQSIAGMLECSQDNSRQLHHRATRRLREERARFEPDHGAWHQLVERFLAAARDGDLARLEELLTADVTSWSDGGGKASAARRPVVGSTQVARLVVGLLRQADEEVTISVREVNGASALLAHSGPTLIAAMVPHVADGRITALRSVTNPDKLRFLQSQLTDDVSHTGGLSGPNG
ncbi:RNA polymerase ECF family sigma subunit [Haloactinospora alba]|uniref:RNA polymerase ECF family sigma subunit n=1 Tax=Haloactinospora alba TaxID=405555 RepID=A0A543N7G1_9ACTN|nr:RNA polymerase sigma-70 factor [Haloactinospora alba]TQN27775.1 RNA polymerase ECF family sigma subunit [Haloactinospora alba]